MGEKEENYVQQYRAAKIRMGSGIRLPEIET